MLRAGWVVRSIRRFDTDAVTGLHDELRYSHVDTLLTQFGLASAPCPQCDGPDSAVECVFATDELRMILERLLEELPGLVGFFVNGLETEFVQEEDECVPGVALAIFFVMSCLELCLPLEVDADVPDVAL